MKKKMINEQVETISPYDLTGSLESLRDRFNELIQKHGADAFIDWNPDNHERYESSPSPQYEIKRLRQETEAEQMKRIAREGEFKNSQEIRELAELERLKQKYSLS